METPEDEEHPAATECATQVRSLTLARVWVVQEVDCPGPVKPFLSSKIASLLNHEDCFLGREWM